MAQTGETTGRTLALRHEASKRVYDYWNALRNGRAAPARHELDPGVLRDLLSSIAILEWRSADHILFRIAGMALCDAFGRELRDHNFLSLWDEAGRRNIRNLLSRAVQNGEGAIVAFRGATLDKQSFPGDILLLPLLDNHGVMTRFIGHFHLYGGVEALLLRKLVRMQCAGTERVDPQRDRVTVDPVLNQPGPRPPLRVVDPALARPQARAAREPILPWTRRLHDFLKADDDDAS